MTVLITLTTAGADTGPFDLYSNLDGYVSAFETGVSKSALLAGYSSALVPNGTTVIRVKSNGVCVNFVDINVVSDTTTTTSTTTAAPVACFAYTVLGGVGGGTWSGLECGTNNPISGGILSGQSLVTPCIVDGSLVLNNATLITQSGCSPTTTTTTTTTPVSSDSWEARYSNSFGSVCGQPSLTVYLPVGAPFTTGTTVFIDTGLTTALTGYTYISELLSGVIYEIDSSNGLIGANTGTTC